MRYGDSISGNSVFHRRLHDKKLEEMKLPFCFNALCLEPLNCFLLGCAAFCYVSCERFHVDSLLSLQYSALFPYPVDWEFKALFIV